LDLDGITPNAAPEPEQRLPGVLNYFLGQDPNGWLTNVPSFARVRYRNVYPGIDVVYYGSEGELEHDFIVAPGADTGRIWMRFTGADVRLEADGSASILASQTKVTWRKPVLYQGDSNHRQPVAGKYRLDSEGRLGFEVNDYDRGKPLVIDPVISYSTFIGRSAAEGAARVVTDAAGNAYVTGFTMDTAFPVTAGAASAGLGAGNILLTKIDPTGATVLYSTFLGGANPEGALGLAIDRDGNIYLAGSTSSKDYPTTPGVVKRALQPPGAPNDPFDCVVTKLNSSGNAILYSTYLGGSGRDACIGIAVDGSGSAYITGNTGSSNFPTTETALQRNLRDVRDGFLAKLSRDGSSLVYSTLFGGTRRDNGVAVAVDSAGAAYVVGNTESSFGFPITPNAFQRNYTGTTFTTSTSGDAFIFKMNPEGTGYVYSSYLGGSRDDQAFSVAVDSQGNAYIAGNTTSTNFPTTAGAYQTAFRGLGDNNIYRGGDGFVTKVAPDGSRLVYSTYLGGSKDDWATGVVIDSAGDAYLVGATASADFPLSQDAHQRTYGGSDPVLGFPTGDVFVAQLNPAGSALVYSTYLGGSADEYGLGIALDASGALVVSGMTRSRNFPVTPGVAQESYGGTDTNYLPLGDVFIVRFAGTGTNPASNVVLGGVASAASYSAGGVAPGEIVVLGGTNIGPTNLAQSNVAQGRFTTQVAGTRVLFDEIPAPIVYVSGTQSSAIVPYGVANRQSTQVVVEFQGQRSAPITMPVVASKPALFSANGSGTGQGAIFNEDFTVNTAAAPSGRGRIVQLFGTGAGRTNPEGVDGLLATTSLPVPVLPVSVTIGGRQADLLYAGAAPNLVAGVIQINAKVPEDTPPGNAEVIVTIGSARSQPGLTVAVR
jgi:uncharacterized protein (TIGR03437 family)